MKMKYSELKQNIMSTLGAMYEKKPKKFEKSGLIAVTVLLVVAAGFLLGNRQPVAMKSRRYITSETTRGDLALKVTTTGNLAPIRKVDVGSELSGIITEVTVDFNDQVKKDQPLAYLDNTNFEAALLASKAALTSAKARLERAEATLLLKKQNLKRLKQASSLSKGQALSQNDLDLAEAEYKIAKAEASDARAAIQQAEANLKVDEYNLSKTIIVSPINGVVLMRNVAPGQTVAASLQAPVLFTLAEDLAQMELHVDVDEADVGKVAEGQWATFIVDAYPDRKFNAVITQVRFGSQSTNGVVTYKTLLRVNNMDLVLRPGMTATADIIIKKISNAVLVPSAALCFTPQDEAAGSQEQAGNGRVWTLKNGRPVPVDVTTGASSGTMTIIEDNNELTPGTPLILNVVEANS
jgi:HlyD family secretion protein